MSAGRAIYSYTAEEGDELSLEAGDALELISLNNEGWWIAKKNGRVGIVPANYVCTEVKGEAHITPVSPVGKADLARTEGKKSQRNMKEKDDLLRIKEQRIRADEKIEVLRNKVSNTERNFVNGDKSSPLGMINTMNSTSSDLSSPNDKYDSNNSNYLSDENAFSQLINTLTGVLNDFSGSEFSSSEYKLYQNIRSLVLNSSTQASPPKGKSIVSSVVVSESYSDLSSHTDNVTQLASKKASQLIAPLSNSNQNKPSSEIRELSDSIKYNHCRSTIYAPSIIPDPLFNGPASKKLRLQHVYGYDGDRTRHANVALNKNIVVGSDNVVLFPIASVVVAYNLATNTQSFYSGHKEDVICVNVHPTRPLAVSGELGKPGRILVWDYNFMRLSRDSFSENNTITELFIGDECRGVRSVSFSGDGRFILSLGLDDANTVVIFDWQSSSIVAVAKLGHPEVSQINFNNFLFNSIDRVSDHQTLSPRSSIKSSNLASLDNSAEDVGCYTIVSCGGKHIKFWTLTRTVIRRDDQITSPDEKSFKGRQLAIPKHKQNVVIKYDLVGNVGTTPKSSAAENIEFTCFACTNNANERGTKKKSRILAGTSVGSIYIWSQLEDEVLSKTANFNVWLARGRLLSVVTDVHDKPIVDMSYYFRWDETTNKPVDKLATCGLDSMINVWNIGDSAEQAALPIRFSSALNLDDSSLMYGFGRAICWNENGRDVIVGTAQNNVVYIPNMDITNDNNLDKELIRLLVSGHSGKIRKIAVHPQEYIFCSISNDKTLRFWDGVSKKVVNITKVKDERGSCLCFNPKGDTLVIGNEFGEISIWNIKINRDKSSKTGTLLGIDVTLQARKYVSSKVASGLGTDVANRPFNGKLRQKQDVSEVKFSPSGNILVAACWDNLIHILSVESNYKRLAVCRGHTSRVKSVDFSVDGNMLQSTDASRELLYWEVSTGKLISTAARIRDIEWHTWSCSFGWPVQGIFNGDSGSLAEGDVNSVCRSHKQDLVVVGGSSRHSVKLFAYPAPPSAIAKQYGGHSSPVQDSLFTVNDSHVITSGGNDTSIFQWEVVQDNY